MNSLARTRTLTLSLVASIASITLAACGLFGSKDDEGELSPAPSGPPAAGTMAAPGAQPLPGGTAAGPAGAAQQPANPGVQPKPPTTPVTDAGAPPPDAGKPDGSAPSDAGATTSTKLKACADKCQAIMQSCLTPSFSDSGVPQIKDPAACQAAFKTCSAACAP